MRARYILPILLLAIPALAQEPEPEAVTLKRPQKAGTVLRYKVSAVADAGGTEVTVERTVKYEVKEIKENGDVVLIMTDQGGKINAMGQEMEVPLATKVTLTTDKLGKIVKYERSLDDLSVMAPEVEHLLAVAQDYVLPDKPVKPGDKWEYELDNPVVKDKKVTIKGTFVGYEKVEETRVWKVKQTMTAVTDSSGSKMEAEMVFLINPEDGVTMRAEGAFKNVPSQYGPVNVTWKTALLKPEPAQPAEK